MSLPETPTTLPNGPPEPDQIEEGQYILMIYDGVGFGWTGLSEADLENDDRLCVVAGFARDFLQGRGGRGSNL